MKLPTAIKAKTKATTSLTNICTFDDDYNEDSEDDVHLKNQIHINCGEDDDEDEDSLESIYEDDVRINFYYY